MKRIALVEDDLALRENYIAALTQHGYQVDAYASRQAAHDAFNLALPDLAIIDIGLGMKWTGALPCVSSCAHFPLHYPLSFLRRATMMSIPSVGYDLAQMIT